MFGSGAQRPHQQGGFGTGQSSGFGQGGFGTGAAGPVKWGGGGKASAAHTQPPGGTVFGQPVQRPNSASAASRGRGRAAGRGTQQGRGWQGSTTPPPGRTQQQPLQQVQQRSPGVLQRLGSLVSSPWGKGQQQQPHQSAGGGTPARAAAAATAALNGGRGSWSDRGRGRGRGSGAGRQQQQPAQQWGSKGGRGQQQRNHAWSREQQQEQPGGRGWGSNSRGRGRGGGRGSSNGGSVFSRLGPGPKQQASAGYAEEEMAPADEPGWDAEGGDAAADGAGGYDHEGWEGHEEEMADMDADEAYADDYHDEQQYDNDEQHDAGEAEEADGDQEEDGVMTAEEMAAAEAAALAATPKFVGGMAGSSKAAGAGFNKGAVANMPSTAAATPEKPASSYLKGAKAGTPGTPTHYDDLQASPSRPDVHKRMMAAALGGLNITPQCNDMCPKAEREQRTADRQLHEFERVAGDYRTDAQHAVKKYTRSEAGGLPDPSLLRTFDALKKTLVHLRGLMARVGDGSNGTCSLLEAHRFLWDRYRSIRKDITQTELIHKGSNQLRWVVAANEEMARFMILADAFLANKDKINYAVKKAKSGAAIEFDMEQFQADAEAAAAERAAAGVANFEPDPYDGHLNHQELSKTLLDLSALYREANRLGVECPNEAEFLAYYLIVSRGTFGSFKQSTANFVRLLNQMNPDVAGSPYIQFALGLSGCLAATNYVGFMKLLKAAPLHLAAAGQIYVPRMRSIALCGMLQSATISSREGTIVRQVPLGVYCKLLGFESADQAWQFVKGHKVKCSKLTVSVDPSTGEQRLEVPNSSLHELVVLKEPHRHCLPWILDKADGAGLGELVSQPCQMPDMAGIKAVQGSAVMFAPRRPAAAPRQQIHVPTSVLQQGLPSTAVLQPRKATPAADKVGAASQQQQQQLQQGRVVQPNGATPAPQGFATSATYARGSAEESPAMMLPDPAAARGTAVFGSLNSTAQPAAANAWGLKQHTNAPAASTAANFAQPPSQQQQIMQQGPWPVQQQQQAAGWGPASTIKVQPQATAVAQQPPQQQQQRQAQMLQQQQQQQQAAAAIAAAVAAERARIAAEFAAKEAALAQRDAEIKRLKKSETELRIIKQAEQLREKCEHDARVLWFSRWMQAAAAAKATRLREQRELEALAAADTALGRMGSHKRPHAAATGIGFDAAAGFQLERQEKRKRCDLHAYEAAMEDTTPLNAASIIAAALAKAAADPEDGDVRSVKQPALAAPPEPLCIPKLPDNSDPTLHGRIEQRAPMTQCAAAPVYFKLLVVSGLGEVDEGLMPPLYQRRVAHWLRHKLATWTPHATAAANGKAAADGLHQLEQHGATAVVPLAGDEQQQATDSQLVTYAAVVIGRAGSSQQQQQGQRLRSVLQFGVAGEAQLLVNTGSRVLVPGTHKQHSLVVDVVDINSSKLTAAVAASGGATGSPPACVAGACAVLLLVSGPDESELAAAVERLKCVLAVAADNVQVPVVALACSGPETQDAVEGPLYSLLNMLPDRLRDKISGASVVCAGPGADPVHALASALQIAAEGAPQLPALRVVSAGNLLQALLCCSLGPAVVSGAAEPSTNLLGTYVAAHNQSVAVMAEFLQTQLDSAVYQWGYPASGAGSNASHIQQIRDLLPRLQALLLPTPAAVEQHQQHHASVDIDSWGDIASVGGVGGAAALQTGSYLRSLSQGHGPVEIAQHAMVASTILQQAATAIRDSYCKGRNGSSSQQQQEQLSTRCMAAAVEALRFLLRLLWQDLQQGGLLILEETMAWLSGKWRELVDVAQQEQQLAAMQLTHNSRGYAALPAAGKRAVGAAAQQRLQDHLQSQDVRALAVYGAAGNAADVPLATAQASSAAAASVSMWDVHAAGPGTASSTPVSAKTAVYSSSWTGTPRSGQHQQLQNGLDIADIKEAAQKQSQGLDELLAEAAFYLSGKLPDLRS